MILKKIVRLVIVFIIVIGITSCTKTNQIEIQKKQNEILEKQKDKELSDLVNKWKNKKNNENNRDEITNYTPTTTEIRYTMNNKLFVIPIYGGVDPSVDFGDINTNPDRNPCDVLHELVFKNTKKLKLKKFFHDILLFYHSKGIIENIERPSGIGFEGGDMAIIAYDYNISGVEGSMQVLLGVKNENYAEKISELEVDEKKMFMIFSFFGEPSGFKLRKLKEQKLTK